MSKRPEDGLDVVGQAVVLGGRLEDRHVVFVGESLGEVGVDADVGRQVIALVADEYARNVVHVDVVPFAFLDPLRQVVERGHAGHVVDEYDGLDVAVVVLHHRFSEALLARRVP